jgi:ribonuclease HI
MRGPENVNHALAVEGFSTEEEVLRYMRGIEPSSASAPTTSYPTTSYPMASHPATSGPTKYYAVAVGSKPGIYYSWTEAEPCTRGRSIHKKFNTLEEAEQFIQEYGTQETCQALGLPPGSRQQARQIQQEREEILEEQAWETRLAPQASQASQKQFKSPAEQIQHERLARNAQAYTRAAFEPVEASARQLMPETTTKPTPKQSAARTDGDTIKIYTDGSSLGNGKPGSRAGLGVFFGHGDDRNHSERLPGQPQTNQRAELMAMLRAMEIAPLTQGIEIWTDSQYSINCATTWANNWERNAWKNSQGKDVSNKDIIRDIRAKIREKKAAGAITEFRWVKGHASDPGNHEADRLANVGSRMPEVV